MEYLSSTSAQTAPRPEHRAENVRNDTGTAVKSWFRPIPIRAMVERLKLMADLELPCTVCLGDTDEEHCCRSVIRTITLADGRLSLDGQGFSLHIREDHIQSVQLVQRRRSGNSETAIEIFSVSGNLLARFVGTPERERAAIWQDIMDSFAVASC
jgi:putative heme degradation protein